jgi:hypothetical protein
MIVKPDSAQTAKRSSGEEATALRGVLKWIEPFTAGKEQTIQMEIQTWSSAEPPGRCVFICASPQPQTAEVWKSLRAIREGTVPIAKSK